jgi:hypothetical protein
MAALQGWDVIWRFAYSHTSGNLFQPGTAGYFDLVSDPLNQAAERASLCLFLRGDMKRAPHTVGIAMTREDCLRDLERNVDTSPGWNALALVTGVGTHVSERPGRVPADIVLPLGWAEGREQYSGGEVLDIAPYSGGAGERILEACRARGWLDGNRTDLSRNVMESETGELLIDAPRDVMALVTSRTAGGYAPEGEMVDAGPGTVRVDRTDATVWVSSVDGRAITESRRLIVTHLTDLQNTGARFGEKARRTLLAWGSLPHLVLDGEATVAIWLANGDGAKVWHLATSGRRMRQVEFERREGGIVLPLRVAGPDGARMIYEVEVR